MPTTSKLISSQSKIKFYPLGNREHVLPNVFCLLLSDYHLFQYFMKIVPTEVNTYANNLKTYQFSVTERVCFTQFNSLTHNYLTNGFSHHYQLDESTFIFRGVRVIFIFYHIFR